uniref:Uncharacterized protein n=1 Tax=Campylobacter lari TaxID=201 RepID=Q1T716_CAMLA|nr:hypothetical protein [Campylobacter lari]BAE93260.1 hypothetical protein [Campylobacter lari]
MNAKDILAEIEGNETHEDHKQKQVFIYDESVEKEYQNFRKNQDSFFLKKSAMQQAEKLEIEISNLEKELQEITEKLNQKKSEFIQALKVINDINNE